MSWGISYTNKGYLIRTTLARLDFDEEEKRDMNDMLWQRIIAMCAMSPTEIRDAEGNPVDWADHVVNEVRSMREEIESNLSFICHAQEIREARAEDPGSVADS